MTAPRQAQERLQVLVTGSAGRVGHCLIEGFGGRYQLRGFDRQKCECQAAVPTTEADLCDLDALHGAMEGVDVVVHLAATKNEAPFVEELMPNNVIWLHNTFEAARQSGVRRIVFASSVQTVAAYPPGQAIRIADPPRPSTAYGATKVLGEALGRFYHDKHGMEFVAIRIGWFLFYDDARLRRAGAGRNLWLSPRDAVRLFGCAIEKPNVSHALVFGTSITAFERLSRAEARDLLGYHAQDDVNLIPLEAP